MNALPGISLKMNLIYLFGLMPFALAVSIRLYIPALAAAPAGLPENNQFFLPIVNGRMLCFARLFENAQLPSKR